LLRYFVAVAEELHFGRAAARLHIAQPSLSHQIRRLEQQLGVTLLERTTRRVTLTPAGQTLLLDGRRLLNQAERVVRTTRAANKEQLAIGFAGSAAQTMLADVLSAFEERQPSVSVAVRELLLDRVDDIRSGRVDLAFTRLLPGQTDLDVEVLAYEPRLVALPAAHRLAARAVVTFADLCDESFITNPAVEGAGPPERWLREQRRHGLPGRVAAEAASVPEILTLVAAGRGVCLVPAAVATHHPRDDVRYIAVADADPAVVSIATAHGPKRPAVEAFAAVARDVAGRH
jgi:DNA-binding transcriptional LysR family regulator